MLATVVADDLTGALEMGALLSAAGLQTLVKIHQAEADDLPCDPDTLVGDALVIDTESRHLPEPQAYNRLFATTVRFRSQTHLHLFKKIDSTMRGPVAAEFLAAMKALGRPAIFIPAYPLLGRTVVDGILHVRGVPVADSEFGKDPRSPVTCSSLIETFAVVGHSVELAGTATDLKRMLSVKDTPEITICDASTESELSSYAAVLKPVAPSVLIAGSGGFGRHWATFPQIVRTVGRHSDPPVSKPMLISGSRHPISRRQTELAISLGVPAIAATANVNVNPSTLCAELAADASTEATRYRPDALIIFGGETAFALLRALGISVLQPMGELLPGIPVSLAAWDGRGLVVVTKAGGFGDEDVVQQILKRLRYTPDSTDITMPS